MNKYRGLLREVANEFHIEQGRSEPEEKWKARTIYTLLGRMAYASLSDCLEDNEVMPEDGEFISITHFKRRIQAILDSYLELYPEVVSLFPTEKEELYGEIYDTYLKSGCLYHTAYRISPSSPCMARQRGLQFERGMPLERSQYISGLGSYLPFDCASEKGRVYSSVAEMFALQSKPLSEVWTDLVSGAKWIPLHTSENIEYFCQRVSRSRWRNTPEQDQSMSIARVGQPGNYLYYLYQLQEGQLLGSQLPQWLVNDPFYGSSSHRIVSNACLAASSHLPAISYKIDGAIVQVRFQYLLPPAEMYWTRLYSWPASFFHFPCDFTRIFAIDVFWAIQAVLEQMGYQFVEE